MNHLTNFYKNKSEILAEQIKFLENQLKQLAEDAPGYSFTPGNKNAPYQSDADLAARAKNIKKSGFFGAQIPDADQSQEYKDIQAELSLRAASKNKNLATSVVKATPDKTPSAQPVKPYDSGMKRMPEIKPKPPSPNPIPQKNGEDRRYDDVESVRSRRSAETQPARQQAAIPNLLQRDPSVPTPPKTGSPAPVSDKQKGVPAPAATAPSAPGKQTVDNTPDWIKNINKPLTLPSDFVGDRSGSDKQSYNFNQSSSDLISKAAQMLGKFNINTSDNTSSTNTRSPSENAARVAADAEARANRGMPESKSQRKARLAKQEADRNANAARVKADSEARATRGMKPQGEVQGETQDQEAVRLAQQQAQRERNAARVKADARARATRGMNYQEEDEVEDSVPAVTAVPEKPGLFGELGNAFGNAGRALFGMPQEVSKSIGRRVY